MRAILILLFFTVCQPTFAACRHALVLALDISGSVNAEEYRLQLDGLAHALLDEEVQDVLFSLPDAHVSISVFEWNSQEHQQLILNWVDIDTQETLQIVAKRLQEYSQERDTLKTAIGEALIFAKKLLNEKSDCWRRTIDISGDGTNNDGPRPKDTYEAHDFTGITVNGLVVTVNEFRTDEEVVKLATQLQSYYDHNVLHGADSFSMPALGYADFKRAMTMKLLKELSPAQLGSKEIVPTGDVKLTNLLPNGLK